MAVDEKSIPLMDMGKDQEDVPSEGLDERSKLVINGNLAPPLSAERGRSTDDAASSSLCGFHTDLCLPGRLFLFAIRCSADVYFRFHAVRKSHAAASLALSLVTIGLYIAMLLPSTVTTHLADVERYAGIQCEEAGTNGSSNVRYLTMCDHLEEDELYVQDKLSTAEVVQFECRNEDDEAVNIRPMFTQMMADEHSTLFFFLPIGKAADTFLAVFFIKSAIGVLMSFGAAGMTLCTTLRPTLAKRHIVSRSVWVWIFPAVFLLIAAGIYSYGYFLMVTEPSDFCMLDRKVGLLEAVDTVPGIIISVVFFVLQLRAVIKTRPSIERDAYLFDPDRPFPWFRVLADKHYKRARAHCEQDVITV